MKRLALLLLLSALPCGATTRYVAQTAGTFSGGQACNGHTAITPATFNSTTLAPGDLTYICGTLTFAASTTGLTISQSGTSGNPITLEFDSGAVMSSPEWPADGTSGAIDIGSNSYITINGNGGAGGWTQGIIEATLNGDSGATCLGGPCTLHGDSNGIEATGSASNIIVEGLSIIDMYVATVPNPGGGSCMYDNGTMVNWTIQNNLMHDMGWCLSFTWGGASSNLTISGNQIYNIDHGLALGSAATGASFTTINIFNNNIHDYSNWDTPGDVWHHDGLHIWGYNDDGSTTITGVNIYDNKFGGCVGQNITAHIFVEQNAGGTTNVKIYNNTLIDTCSGNDVDGLLTTGVDSGYKIYNNTFIGTAGDTCVGTSSSPSVAFINNVVTGCGKLMYVTSGGGFSAASLHNNIYAGCTGGSNCYDYQGTFTGSFATWQSMTGQDASPSASPASAGINASGVPQSGSAVIGVGANLTSLGITTLNSDIAGTARPTSGAWDAGAYKYGSSAPAPVARLSGSVVLLSSVNASASTSGATSVIPSNAQSTTNIQSRGNWKGQFDPGTSGTASGTMSIASSPSLSGTALKTVTSFTNNGGWLYYDNFTTPNADTTSLNWFLDEWIYLASPTSALANVETDLNQVDPSGNTVIMGFQCDGWNNTWDYTYTDTGSHWTQSTQPCNPRNWTTNTWHHLQIYFSRDTSDNVTYHSVWLDNQEYPINATVHSGLALGWANSNIMNFQIDGTGASGSVTAYLDNSTVYRW